MSPCFCCSGSGPHLSLMVFCNHCLQHFINHYVFKFFLLKYSWFMANLCYRAKWLSLYTYRHFLKIFFSIMVCISFPHGAVIENTPANARDAGDWGFDPWVGKIPWRRKWQPTPVFLPRKSLGLRTLVSYSPRVRKELDTTERLHFHFQRDISLGVLLFSIEIKH